MEGLSTGQGHESPLLTSSASRNGSSQLGRRRGAVRPSCTAASGSVSGSSQLPPRARATQTCGRCATSEGLCPKPASAGFPASGTRRLIQTQWIKEFVWPTAVTESTGLRVPWSPLSSDEPDRTIDGKLVSSL